MGCICSKGTSDAVEYAESQKENELSKSCKPLVTSSKREDNVVEVDGGVGTNGSVQLSRPPSQKFMVSSSISSNEGMNKVVVNERVSVNNHHRSATVAVRVNVEDPPLSRIVSISRAAEGEQAAAGWPSWLTAVAGDAIKGWLPRKADSFEKLDKIGQGTYSNVYRARDLETGKTVALKKVRFVNMDPESVRFMAREIHILRRLDHPNVIKLEGLITSRMSSSLYLVFEYMEHDLAGLAASPAIKFTEPQIKCYMQQLLRGLEHCHSRGVLHRDIKGSNLLVDNNGNLRIADFGLATFFRPDQNQTMTSRVVTLWYRPPELLLGATEYGVGVDLWSSGCILAELFAGKPIMPGRTEVEQLHKIFKLCGSPSEEYFKKSRLPHATIFKPQQPYQRHVAETFKDVNSSALSLIDVLLTIEPEKRGSAASALESEFFMTEPLPCAPASLPKYPPSKEYDAKLRDEEERRHRASVKAHGSESVRGVTRDSKAVAAPEANTELQKRQGLSNPKSNSEKYNPLEDGGSLRNGFAHSGSLIHQASVGPSRSSRNGPELRTQRSHMPQGGSARGSGWSEQHLSAKYNQLDDVDPPVKKEWSHNVLDRPGSSHKKDDRSYTKESTTGYIPKKNRIHYSGPLMPPGGNIDEMLKEHERQIQQAVRKARLDKSKTNNTHSGSVQKGR